MRQTCLKAAVRSLLHAILVVGFCGPASSAPPATIPAVEDCTIIHLSIDEGWWLQIRKSGLAAYGFGALPQRVTVKKGVFSLEEIYRDVIDDVVEPFPNARITVVFSPMAPGSEGRVFALKSADSAVSELFARAYRERDGSLDDGFQQDAIRHLDPFWTRAPFLR